MRGHNPKNKDSLEQETRSWKPRLRGHLTRAHRAHVRWPTLRTDIGEVAEWRWAFSSRRTRGMTRHDHSGPCETRSDVSPPAAAICGLRQHSYARMGKTRGGFLREPPPLFAVLSVPSLGGPWMPRRVTVQPRLRGHWTTQPRLRGHCCLSSLASREFQ